MQSASKITLGYKKIAPLLTPGPNLLLQNKNGMKESIKETNRDHANKLYTFCSSQMKNKQYLYLNTSNEESMPNNSLVYETIQESSTTRKVYEKRETQKNKGKFIIDSNRSNKRERKLSNNISLIVRRPSQQKLTRKEKQRKTESQVMINIDLNSIHKKEILEKSQRNNTDKAGNYNYNEGFLLQQSKLGFNKKIVIDQEELRRFTNKFAKEKLQYEDRLDKLEIHIEELKQSKKTQDLEKQDLSQCLNFQQCEYDRLKEVVGPLEKEVNLLQNQKQYLMIARDEYKQKMKVKEDALYRKQQETQQLKQQLNKTHKYYETKLAEIQQKIHNEYSNKLSLMNIQIDFLSAQLEIYHQNISLSQRQLQSSHSQQRSSDEESKDKEFFYEQISKLKDTNAYLMNELIKMSTLKAEKDAIKKALQLSQNRILCLSAQLNFIKQKTVESFSQKQSQNESIFEYKFGGDTSQALEDSIMMKAGCRSTIFPKRDYQMKSSFQLDNYGYFFSSNIGY